jgi:hypothetical protein
MSWQEVMAIVFGLCTDKSIFSLINNVNNNIFVNQYFNSSNFNETVDKKTIELLRTASQKYSQKINNILTQLCNAHLKSALREIRNRRNFPSKEKRLQISVNN